MNVFDLLRRTFGLVVFTIVVWVATHNHWLSHDFTSFGKIAALVGFAVAVFALIWAIFHPSPQSVVVGVVIGVAGCLWAEHEFHLKTTLGLVGAGVAFLVFWAWIVLDVHTLSKIFGRRPAARRAAS